MLEYGFHLPRYQEEGMLFRFDSNRQILKTLSFETVWDNTLADHLAHLIRPKTTSPDRKLTVDLPA